MVDAISLAIIVRPMRISGSSVLLEGGLVLRIRVGGIRCWSRSMTTSCGVERVLTCSLRLLVVMHLLFQMIVCHLRDLLRCGLRVLCLQLMRDLDD